MKLAHINLVARDADRLAAFYQNVMHCTLLRSPRKLSGEMVSRGNGLKNSEIYSIWLAFDGIEYPFLEIHQHGELLERAAPRVNEPGYGHLSFQTKEIGQVLAKIIAAGGTQIGEMTNFGSPEQPYFIAYARDPEGNILELEQLRS